MSETWRIGLLGAAAGLALILGVIALVRISELRSDVQRLDALAGEVSSLQASLRTAEERIAELEESQGWIANLEWTIDDDVPAGCEGEIPVVATWTFQEINRNADVAIEFRNDQQSEWERFPAESQSGPEYAAVAGLESTVQWKYRFVAESDEGVRVSPEKDFLEFDDLIRQDPMIEIGESVSDDGVTWFRYVVASWGDNVSPCNQIVDAEIQVYDGDDLVETVGMSPEYPGEYVPDGVDIEMRAGDPLDEGEAAEDPAAFSIHGAQPTWWSDWVRKDEELEISARVEFGDGTEIVMDERGIY